MKKKKKYIKPETKVIVVKTENIMAASATDTDHLHPTEDSVTSEPWETNYFNIQL